MRIKDDLADLLDAKLKELEKAVPGVNWNRLEVARYVLYGALRPVVEGEDADE